MKFDELDKQMRVFETASDLYVLPEMYIVARIDGRSFTRLTKKTLPFDAPFDIRFRDLMVETTKHLMGCGIKVVYGYTQSDEISLLFDYNESSFGRKQRKLISILAGEASAKFSLLLGTLAAFDCRICTFPNEKLVVDYFRWRNEDAHRNSLNAHCYWKLRQNGHSKTEATQQIVRRSVADKNELLFGYGVNFNELPTWQRRGIGLRWTEVEKVGFNPKANKTVTSLRKQIEVVYDLPMKDEYSNFVTSIVAGKPQD